MGEGSGIGVCATTVGDSVGNGAEEETNGIAVQASVIVVDRKITIQFERFIPIHSAMQQTIH
jgi:hypothetical protein